MRKQKEIAMVRSVPNCSQLLSKKLDAGRDLPEIGVEKLFCCSSRLFAYMGDF
jgi:hypothetical protein